MRKKLFLLLANFFIWFGVANANEKIFKKLDTLFKKQEFRAEYVYTVYDNSSMENKSMYGKITVKGNKYHIKMIDQEILNDGTTVWVYLPGSNEVQISNYDLEDELCNPWHMICKYRTAYTLYKSYSKKSDKIEYYVIELIAKEDDNQYPYVTVDLSKSGKDLKKIEIIDKDKILHKFDLISFSSVVNFKDETFVFCPEVYNDIEIIDLR